MIALRHVLAALIGAGSLLAQPQEVARTPDWPEVVETAVEHPRFAVRRAAAGKVARAGGEAVPALARYAEEHGRNALPLELVDAIARGPEPGDATKALLRSWAEDRDFYWRAQALEGLARQPDADVMELCRAALGDPSYLYRVAGARAVVQSDDAADRAAVRALLDDPDPRARVRVALLLLEQGDDAGVGEIVAAFDRTEARFLDDPWGAREAMFVARELQRIAGQDVRGLLGDDEAERAAAREALTSWALEHRPDLEMAERTAPAPEATGGVEVRSCKHGDLHLRWTADGRLLEGLAPLREWPLDRERLGSLEKELEPLAGSEVHGKVVCDFVRLYVPRTPDGGEVHRKAAPGALPDAMRDWLKAFGRTIEKSGSAAVERELESRLSQFAGTRRD